jgi:septal ring factor EnvC (AmiA/AmiB activator)
MTDMAQPTAEILPFRVARPVAPRAASAAANQEAQERLARALARLNAALAEQRTAAVALRTAVGDLQGAMGSLGNSLRKYNAQLDTVATRVGLLREQAVQLEAWADRALAQK